MFYIINDSFSPNTASGNRFLTFLKGFDELGVVGTAVLLQPSHGHDKVGDIYQNIKIMCQWKDWPCARKLLDRLYRPIGLKRFISILKYGDVVFCYGSPGLVVKLLSKKGVKVYHERTESPEVLPLPTQKEQAQYLDACKKLDGLFIISTALKQYFINLGVEEKKIIIVNMTVDCQRFARLEKRPFVERYVAYCGTASNNKDGVDELIKAFALVSKKHKDVKLYIIGAAPTAHDEAGNLRLIETLGIMDKVVLTGVVDANCMPQLLKDATVLALDRPNSLQAQNGFPTKLGEYLMTENPVVVTKVGDIPLFLKDGDSALLAEQRNTDEFASKLNWVLEHPQEAAKIGKKGKQVALTEFNYLTESKEIIDFIYGKDTCSW